MTYNQNNIFAKILRGEIPSKKIFENDYILAFEDIHPKAPIHVLAIPKGPYVSSSDFYKNASDAEVLGFQRGLIQVLETLHLHESQGYRLISNCGVQGGQEVEHFHIHILAGKKLGALVGS